MPPFCGKVLYKTEESQVLIPFIFDFVGSDRMSNDLRDIQKVETSLIRIVADICDRHELTYFLDCGTLLGAVRHSGPIPWDDDADLMMPVEQIPLLAEYIRQEAPQCTFESAYTNIYHPLPWAKIRMNGTTSMPIAQKTLPIHWGICIDIFPLVAIKNTSASRKLALFRYKTAKKLLYSLISGFDNSTKTGDKLLGIFSAKFRNRLAKRYLNRIGSVGSEGKGTFFFSMPMDKMMFPSEYIYDGQKHFLTYDGYDFRVPADPDRYLTLLYGDYMTPPLDKRQGHERQSGQIIWDTDRDYREYL